MQQFEETQLPGGKDTVVIQTPPRLETAAKVTAPGAESNLEPLLTAAGQGVRKWRARRRTAMRMLLLSVIPLTVFSNWLFHLSGEAPLYWTIFWVGWAVAWGLWSFRSRAKKHLNRRAIRELAEVEDTRAIGALTEALFYPSRREPRGVIPLKKVAAAALIRLLPQLHANDADVLTSRQKSCLYYALAGRNPELIAAILRALPLIGDGRALAPVQNLADGNGVAANNPELRHSAENCLLALRQRLEQEQVNATLLRASSVSDTGAETLLRAARETGSEPSDQLLRPGGI